MDHDDADDLRFAPTRCGPRRPFSGFRSIPQGVLFATEAFEHAVEQHALTGFRLDMVWSLKGGGVGDPPGVGFGGVFDRADPAQLAGKRAAAKALLGAGAGRPRASDLAVG